MNSQRLICNGKWSLNNGRSPVTLIGDSAHTAHSAVGWGAKLAIGDAIELARQFDLRLRAALSAPKLDAARDGPRRQGAGEWRFRRGDPACEGGGRRLVGLHCAHRYILSSLLSSLTIDRDKDYAGSHENRARYLLEVSRAVRAAWLQDRTISVRLSCHDPTTGGNLLEDALISARMFQKACADLVDRSSGLVSKAERPVYGRLFQTPLSDLIRNETATATTAVGAISQSDHANSIIAAGRADLCAIARPHLADAA